MNSGDKSNKIKKLRGVIKKLKRENRELKEWKDTYFDIIMKQKLKEEK